MGVGVAQAEAISASLPTDVEDSRQGRIVLVVSPAIADAGIDKALLHLIILLGIHPLATLYMVNDGLLLRVAIGERGDQAEPMAATLVEVPALAERDLVVLRERSLALMDGKVVGGQSLALLKELRNGVVRVERYLVQSLREGAPTVVIAEPVPLSSDAVLLRLEGAERVVASASADGDKVLRRYVSRGDLDQAAREVATDIWRSRLEDRHIVYERGRD